MASKVSYNKASKVFKEFPAVKYLYVDPKTGTPYFACVRNRKDLVQVTRESIKSKS